MGKIEGGRRRGQQDEICWMALWTQCTSVWVSSRSWWWTGKPGMLHKELDTTERLNWTEWWWTPFHGHVGLLYVFFGEISIQLFYFWTIDMARWWVPPLWLHYSTWWHSFDHRHYFRRPYFARGYVLTSLPTLNKKPVKLGTTYKKGNVSWNCKLRLGTENCKNYCHEQLCPNICIKNLDWPLAWFLAAT